MKIKKKNKKKSVIKKYAHSYGILSFFENIIRSHPVIYFFIRKLIRFTNIFEEDANGVKIINFQNEINIMDIGASDGIASKFFLKNLKVKKIYCYEPDKQYIKILKKLDKKIIVKSYAVGNKNENLDVYYPEVKILGKKIKLVTYCYYNKIDLEKQINLDFKFKKNLKIIKKNLHIKKISKFNDKIDLIKIDVNGFEYFVIEGLSEIIKKNKPAIILETGKDIKKINNVLKKFNYKQFIYSKIENKFYNYKKKNALNTYFLQDNHIRNL